MNEQEAWAAGVFEGEGWVQAGRYTLRLGIEMTDRDVLCRVAAVLGGSVTGPRSREAGRKPLWVWRSENGTGALAVIAKVRPWLGVRRTAQVDAACETWSHRLDHRPRELPCVYCGKPVPQPMRGTTRKACSSVCYSRSRAGTPRCRACKAELPMNYRKRYCEECRAKDVLGERRRAYQRQWYQDRKAPIAMA